MRTTKKEEVIPEQQEDEYLDFILGGPGGFAKQTPGKTPANKGPNKKLNKSTTMKKLRNTQTLISQ
jgi:hypothetical protein